MNFIFARLSTPFATMFWFLFCVQTGKHGIGSEESSILTLATATILTVIPTALEDPHKPRHCVPPWHMSSSTRFLPSTRRRPQQERRPPPVMPAVRPGKIVHELLELRNPRGVSAKISVNIDRVMIRRCDEERRELVRLVLHHFVPQQSWGGTQCRFIFLHYIGRQPLHHACPLKDL